MIKSALVSVAILGFISSATAQTTYTINGWPQGLQTIPCDAFKKNPDGSWTQTGTIIVMPSHAQMIGITFKTPSPEVQMLEKRCAQ